MFMPIGKPMSVGLGALDIDSIERAVKPTEAQRAAFDELKAISAKAEEAVRKACPGSPPETPLARLEMMETRIDTMLTAVRTLRPALQSFYRTLTDEQKKRFDAVRPNKQSRGAGCHEHG
jgi:phage shock protein A